MRKAAELVKASTEGNALQVRAILARKADLPQITRALVRMLEAVAETGMPVVANMRQVADLMEHNDAEGGSSA